jgi:hypothetical protein
MPGFRVKLGTAKQKTTGRGVTKWCYRQLRVMFIAKAKAAPKGLAIVVPDPL